VEFIITVDQLHSCYDVNATSKQVIKNPIVTV